VLEPVLAHEHEALDAGALPQEVDRPAADDADDAEPAREVAQRIEGAGQRDGVAGMVDDRGERAVEVDDARGATRVAAERGECVERSYEPRMTRQSALLTSTPSGGGSGNGTTE
jgi:hypothetical protein